MSCVSILAVVPVLAAALLQAAEKPGSTASPPGSGVKVKYTLDKDCTVTLNITRPDGWVVRELLVASRQSAGAHEVSWDGRDNLGYLLAPGAYQSRMVTHGGITWDYVTSVGNSGTPPWPVPDRAGGWGGNHGQNMAVAADASGGYLGWVGTEGPACILKRTHDGSQGIWGMHLGPFEGVACLATDGNFLYGANGTRLIVIDKNQGQQVATVNIQAGPVGEVKAPLPAVLTKFSWGFATHQAPPKGDPLVWGLAAGAGRVYVSLPWRDVVEVYEVVTGAGAVELKLKAEESIPVSKPAGLALDGKGNLLVVAAAEKRVVQFDLKTRQSKPLVKELESPLAIARSADGTLYITETAPINQIKKFGADGRLLATFGKKGGPPGAATSGTAYAADSFYQPCALAANPDGSIWFVDDQFKRMGILSPAGKLQYAGFGSVNYAATCAINPNDPDEVFTTMWVDATFRIDYAKSGWSQPARWMKVKWKGDSQGLDLGFGPARLIARGKQTYLWTGSGLSLVEKDHLRPVMFFNPRILEEGRVGELARQRNVKARGWNCDPTVWCDRNDDGAVQDGEIQFVPLPGAKHGPQYFGFGGMTDDFSLITYGYRWKPKEFTAGGAPVYRPEDIEHSTAHNPVVSWGEECEGAMALPNGGYCGFSHAGDPGGALGQGFWSGRSAGEAIHGYGPDWKLLWRVGRKARRTARPGEIYYLYRSLGTLDGCAFFSDVEGCVHVVQQDGFYLQRVLQDGWHTRAVGPDVIGIENFSGSLFKHPQTGRRYLTISTAEATNVFELKGLESVRVVPPQPIVLAAARIAPDVLLHSAAGEYQIRRVPEGAVPLPPHLFGVLPQQSGLNWVADVAPLVVLRGGKPAGEVRMLYDKENLYVLAHSLISQGDGPAPLHPDGESVKGSPLEAGETMVVLMSGPQSRSPAPGRQNPGAAKVKPSPVLSATPRVRFVMSNVNTVGPKVMMQLDGESSAGRPGGQAHWKAAARNSRVDAMPYHNGACYQLVIPLAGIIPTGDLNGPKSVRLDVGFIATDVATRKPEIVYWSGKGKNMSDPADQSFSPEAWGTATFLPETVLSESNATAVAFKAPRGATAASRWTRSTSYGLGGLSEANSPASFQATWDDAGLFVRVSVKDGTPLQNRSGVPEMLFKGGDAVSLVFGKSGNDGGEQRIILSRVNGKPLAVLYRPKSDVKQPYTFKSPISTETFDYVAPLSLAKVVFTQSQTGYVAEINVPWNVLGYPPVAGRSIPFDAQVIFSDGAGSANASCIWWRSASAEAHANNDVPTEARLYPDQWGRLTLEAGPADSRKPVPGNKR